MDPTNQVITCKSVGVYALTRGRQYVLIAHDTAKKQVKVRADSGRSRWFPSGFFDLNGGPVPVLCSWNFGDPVVNPLNGWDETNNWVHVTVTLDDNSERWCEMTTPRYLRNLLDDPYSEPMICSRNLIIVRDLTEATVEHVLIHLDQQGELSEFSQPLDAETLFTAPETKSLS